MSFLAPKTLRNEQNYKQHATNINIKPVNIGDELKLETLGSGTAESQTKNCSGQQNPPPKKKPKQEDFQ